MAKLGNNNILEGDGKAIFIVFVGAVICAVLIASIATTVNSQVNTLTDDNVSFSTQADATTITELAGREIISVQKIYVSNATGRITIADNSTVTTGQQADGLQGVNVRLTADGATNFASQSGNISYTYRPDGYLNDSGSRSVNNLVILFAALAIVVFTIIMFIKTGTLGKMMRS